MYEQFMPSPFWTNDEEQLQMVDPYAPQTDFGRVSMGQAPMPAAQEEQPAIEDQVVTAQVMDSANINAAGDIGAAVAAERPFQYTSVGATDTEALGEGMFAFGLAMLAASSRPGADFGAAMAEGLGSGAKTFSNALNRNKRFENIGALEKKGFTQESIDAYIQSGDNKALVKNPVAPNHIKVKDVNGVTYQYDERNPAGTMQEINRGPKQVKGSVDMGDRVLIHYTDGTSEERAKGMTAAERRLAAKGTGSGNGSGGKPDWDKELIEWQDPETKEFKTMTVRYDKNNPQSGYFSLQGAPVDIPEGAQMTSEAQQVRRADNRYKAQDEATALGNTIANNTAYTEQLLGTSVNFYDPTRLLPYTPSSERQKVLETAKSNLMVSQYSSMPGVAGASVQTEQQIIKAIPNPTDSIEVKTKWANKKLDYDIKVLTATIKRQEERYGQASQGLVDTLRTVEQQKERINEALENYEVESRNAKAAPETIRAPGSVQQGGSAYGGAAQAQKPASDFSSYW